MLGVTEARKEENKGSKLHPLQSLAVLLSTLMRASLALKRRGLTVIEDNELCSKA